jgi:hypothetical protein
MSDSANEFQIKPAPAADTISIFLGLFLLLLAFFILLVSISTVEKVKSLRVMDSVAAAFATILPTSVELRDEATKDANILSGEAFQAEITGIYATQVQVTKVEVVTPGRLMRVVMPSDALFFPGEARLREGQFPFIDRMVAALSGRPAGMRHELEFVIGNALQAERSLPVGETLESRRAVTFVKGVLARGAPPDSVSVGLMPGDPNEVTIWFHTRFTDEADERFSADPAARR